MSAKRLERARRAHKYRREQLGVSLAPKYENSEQVASLALLKENSVYGDYVPPMCRVSRRATVERVNIPSGSWKMIDTRSKEERRVRDARSRILWTPPPLPSDSALLLPSDERQIDAGDSVALARHVHAFQSRKSDVDERHFRFKIHQQQRHHQTAQQSFVGTEKAEEKIGNESLKPACAQHARLASKKKENESSKQALQVANWLQMSFQCNKYHRELGSAKLLL